MYVKRMNRCCLGDSGDFQTILSNFIYANLKLLAFKFVFLEGLNDRVAEEECVTTVDNRDQAVLRIFKLFICYQVSNK